MGQAKQRGTYAERVQQAQSREKAEAERCDRRAGKAVVARGNRDARNGRAASPPH